MRLLGCVIVLAMMFVTLIACGAGPAAERPATTPSPDATTGEAKLTRSDQEVFFPQERATGGPIAVPSARGSGRLRLDDEGCIRMTIPGEGPESGWVPVVWPSYLELDTGGGKVRILDRRSGRVVAEVGKRVIMGGGEITREALRENGIMEEEQVSELFERCPGDYWMVGEGVQIPRQE